MADESGSSPSPIKGRPSSSPSHSEQASGATGRIRILLVEDNSADIFLVQEGLLAHRIDADLDTVEDGEAAIAYINRLEADPSLDYPAVILLDLNLPKRSGKDVLAHLRGTRRGAAACVIVMSSSSSPNDQRDARQLGAGAYFHKPSTYQGFLRIGELISQLLGPSTF